jgi:hypothetical protein
MTHQLETDSAATRVELRRLNGAKVMLAFSRGKDAIGAWLALRADGFDVIPVHYETCPGLSFVNESLAYYERFFGVSILSLPHPSFLKALDAGLFQTPRSQSLLDAASFSRELEYRDIFDDVAAMHGCGLWYATGVRASDSLTRRMNLKRNGALIASESKAHVIWDWTAEHLRTVIRAAGVKLPIDYRLFGRSFDGVGAEYLHAIRREFPADYARILQYFPLADVEMFRDDRMRHAKTNNRRSSP